MQALILAAGMGKRLGKYTQDNTKCMVEVGGVSLITRALDALSSLRIEGQPLSRVILVVGYKSENVKAKVGASFNGLKIDFVENPIYDKTNNIYSLWLARNEFAKDDTILLESDVIFEKKILERLVDDNRSDLVVVDKYKMLMDGTVVLLDGNDSILNFISKKAFNYHFADDYYKTVNIYKFSSDFINRVYLPFLDAYSKAFGNNDYYEQVLRILTFTDEIGLKALRLSGEKWYEIDDAQDLEIASSLFSDADSRYKLMISSYGGYWRYPDIKDFCYLVNPYFPCPQLNEEMRYHFKELISQYPSGLNRQNMLAAKMFGAEPSCFLVGNGAAELIPAAMQCLPGKVGVFVPSFNEYAERIGKDRVVEFSTSSYGFRPAVDWYISCGEQCSALILVNPENPTGYSLGKNDVLKLADSFLKKNKLLILDESFIDFADEDMAFTCLDQEILDAYPNVIVIRSISKTYGIPGLRLGFLACSNRMLLSQIRQKLPIWNINSLAEYFLQTIGKYVKQYNESCRLIAKERRRFSERLSSLKGVSVYPSQANYVMCRIEGVDTTALARHALCEGNILIKSLNGKKGLPDDGTYVRLAVRTPEDNDVLISTLAEYIYKAAQA